MADYLIAREGFPRVVEYFRSFSRSPHRQENFRQAFSRGLDEFEREILTYLQTVTQ
jgi:hypothetical protein